MRQSLEATFIDNLKFYRTKAKLSQEKLSARLDKNINYINVIEGGKSIPPLSVIEQIAAVLDVEPYFLLKPRDAGERAFDKADFTEKASALIAEKSKTILLGLLK